MKTVLPSTMVSMLYVLLLSRLFIHFCFSDKLSNTICSLHLFTQNASGGGVEKKIRMYSRGGWDGYVYNFEDARRFEPLFDDSGVSVIVV